MKRTKLLIFIFLGTILLLSLFRMAVSNALSTDGIALSSIQDNIEQYKKDNLILSQQIYEASSLTYIEDSATTLGFTDEKSRVALNGPLPLAIKQ